MNIKLDHIANSFCDRRIIAMGFKDVSYINDATGSVMKKVGNSEYFIYCPNATYDQTISGQHHHQSDKAYQVQTID